MKKKFRLVLKTTLSFFLTLILIEKSYSQANGYNCYLKNIVSIDSKHLQFDIWLEWTGTNPQLFCGFQAGINFNYAGISNGGVITGEFVPGSANQLPYPQSSPHWNINQTSHQIRLLFSPATPVANAVPVPSPPGFRIGTFRMTNTVEFLPESTPDFSWSYAVGDAHHTQTKVFFYLGGTATDLTVDTVHFVIGNPPLSHFCTEANAGGPYYSCGNVDLNGSLSTSTTGYWITSGTGTFFPDDKTLNATYLPSGDDILSGGVVLTLFSDSAECTSSAFLTFTLNDFNVCTIDFCDQSTGIASHTPTPHVFLGFDTTITGTLTLDAGPGYANYLWIPGGETTQTITIKESGAYAVTVTDVNGCFGSDKIRIIVLGVEDLISSNDVLIFPNPSRGRIQIKLDNPYENSRIEISNSLSKLVYTNTFSDSNLNDNIDVNLSSGVYILRLYAGDKIFTRKIIVE